MTSLLKSYKAVAYKELVSVDLPDKGSNQHELNGVNSLQEFFDTSERVRGEIIWQFYTDNEEPEFDQGKYTFYDAREKHPTRTEWRLYYQGDFLSYAKPGDVVVFTRDFHDRVHGLLFQKGSGWLRAAIKFFRLDIESLKIKTVAENQLDSNEFDVGRRWIAKELQLELPLFPAPSDAELVGYEFNYEFPTSSEMSRFAREKAGNYVTDPDSTLISWLEREEQLFIALENIIVGPRLKEGFKDVDEFIQYSLSVQNRRKSRMGLSFQNQLSALFNSMNISYTPQGVTEGNNKPDFIFPGIQQYHDKSFEPAYLTMLGVKSSCKERWRQILTEADRIPEKHLCTLDQSISDAQLEEMKTQNVTLVIPESMRVVYKDSDAYVLNLADFVSLIRENEKNVKRY